MQLHHAKRPVTAGHEHHVQRETHPDSVDAAAAWDQESGCGRELAQAGQPDEPLRVPAGDGHGERVAGRCPEN